MTYVYVVSYKTNQVTTPTITVFDNEDSALRMFDYLKNEGIYAWIDVCPLYHTFTEW